MRRVTEVISLKLSAGSVLLGLELKTYNERISRNFQLDSLCTYVNLRERGWGW